MHPFVAFSGKMCSGKSTISKEIANKNGYKVMAIGSTIKNVSNLLIENQSELVNYLTFQLKDQEEVKKVMIKLERMYKKNFLEAVWEKDEDGQFIKNNWYRQLVQDVGIEVRNLYGSDIWIRWFIKEVEKEKEQGNKIICDDLRLKSEKKLLEQNGFTIIRVDINTNVQQQRIMQLYGKINEKQLNHITETDLDFELFDLRIDNSFTPISETIQKVENFLI